MPIRTRSSPSLSWHISAFLAIVALGVTVLGLSAVNGSDALEAVLDGRTTIAYWVQTGLIALYSILLVVLYAAGKRTSRSDE